MLKNIAFTVWDIFKEMIKIYFKCLGILCLGVFSFAILFICRND